MVCQERLLKRRSLCGRALSLALVFAMLFSMAAPASAGMMFGVVRTEDEFSVGELTGGDGTYEVRVAYGEGAGLPEGARLVTYEIAPGTAEFDRYLAAVEKTAEDGVDTVFTRFFEIGLTDEDGAPIQPLEPVEVTVTVPEAEELPEDGDVTVVHFPEEDPAEPGVSGLMADLPLMGIGREDTVSPDVMPEEEPVSDDFTAQAEESDAPRMETVDADRTGSGLVFMADGFSVYGVIGARMIRTRVLTAGGEEFDITVTFDERAGIPDTAELAAEEVENPDTLSAAQDALGGGMIRSSHLFDIRIMNGTEEIQPLVPVQVRIEVAEEVKGTSTVGTVHFHGEDEPEVIDAQVETIREWMEAVTFETDSFSIFAVVVIDHEEGEFVFKDENYSVTIGYTKEANIPLGTDLTVREIAYDTDEYWDLWNRTVEKLNEDTPPYGELEGDHRKGITDAVFFDISLEKDGEPVEPDVPLQVRIEYLNDNGIFTPEGEENGVVHFGEDGPELIGDVEASGEENCVLKDSFSYAQGSFSPVGTFSTGAYIDQSLPVIEPLEPFEAVRPLGLALRAEGDGDAIRMTANKSVDPNGDGTSTLHLTLTGQAQSSHDAEVPKVNVVLVVDTSGSMGENTGYELYGSTSATTAQQAFESASSTGQNNSNTRQWVSSPTYYKQNSNGTYAQVYPVRVRDNVYSNWRYVWRNGNNWNSSEYTGAVYVQQTRLDATKAALYTLVDALLANNHPGEYLEDKDGNQISLGDIMEITLVDFSGNTTYNGSTDISDARVHNPRKATSAGTVTDSSTLKGQIAALTASGGTNWEAALRRAKSVMQEDYGTQTGEQNVVIFVTDGMPTFYLDNANHRSGGYGGTGGEERDNVHDAWTYAADDARALKTAGYELYSIFAYGKDSTGWNNDGGRKPNEYLEALQNYYDTGNGSYTNTTDNPNCFNATNTTALQEALKKIANMINNLTAFGAVDVHDGVSFGATNTSLLLNDGSLDPSSLTYTVTGAEDADCFSVRVKNGVPVFTIGKNNPQTVNGTITTVKVPNPADPNNRSADLTCTVYKATVGEGENARDYIMPPANLYTEQGGTRKGVEWNLTGVGLIQDGITYDLSFIIWPNQTAYDLVAKLENGDITEEQAAAQYPDIWPYVEKVTNPDTGEVTYNLATNWEQNVTYYQVDETTQNGETTYTYNEQPPLPLSPGSTTLAKTMMDVIKIWNDSLDDSQLHNLLYDERGNSRKYNVDLRLYADDTLAGVEAKIDAMGDNFAKRFSLGWDSTKNDYVWTDEYAVAPGVMVRENSPSAVNLGLTKESHEGYDLAKYNGQYYFILESGHYYSFVEENVDEHFILEDHIFHPMVVDSVTQDVAFGGILADDPYGAIDVTDITPMYSVHATNTLRGGINIYKEVRDQTGGLMDTDLIFEATVTMNAPKDRKGNPDLSNLDSYYEGNTLMDSSVAWYIYVDEDGNRVYDDDLIEAGILADSGDTYTWVDAGGTEHTSKIGTGVNHPREKFDYYGSGYFMLDFDNTTGVLTGTVRLTPKYSIRFVNMATGTTYAVTETEKHGMTDTYSYTHAGMVMSDPNDPNSPLIRQETVDQSAADHKVEGNKENNVTVTNSTKSSDVNVVKIGDFAADHPQAGVKFKLFSDAALTKQMTCDSLGMRTLTDAEKEAASVPAGQTPTPVGGAAGVGYGSALEPVTSEITVTDEATGASETRYYAEIPGYDGWLVTGADGRISLGTLIEGTYYLVEYTASPGYNLLAQPVKIIVSEDEHGDPIVNYEQVGYNVDENGDPIPQGSHTYVVDKTDRTQNPILHFSYDIYVNNTSGYELPSTGSFGTLPILAAGAVLAVGSATTLALAEIQRRRREEE